MRTRTEGKESLRNLHGDRDPSEGKREERGVVGRRDDMRSVPGGSFTGKSEGKKSGTFGRVRGKTFNAGETT